jgi:hypothetical protein
VIALQTSLTAEIAENAEIALMSRLGALGDLSRKGVWTGRILPRDVSDVRSLDRMLGRKA